MFQMWWGWSDEVRPEALQSGACAEENDGPGGVDKTKMSAEAIARSVISIRMREREERESDTILTDNFIIESRQRAEDNYSV